MSELIFVYNADSSLFAAVSDYVHKIVSPDTYNCQICKVTYGNLGMKKEWKNFIGNLANDARFLHRNEFEEFYPNFKTTYPVIIESEDGNLSVLITTKQLNETEDLEGMIKIVENSLV